MGGAVSTGEDNDDLIDNLLMADYIKTPTVERIFRAVDRAFYYTDDQKETAYKDVAWKHGNLHLSAPCIYSEVMESLKLEPNLSFLNLGCGTGYLSTMAGLILGPYGLNHGVEIHADVVDYANKKLEEFKCHSAALDEYEFCEPKFVVGNCLQLGSECRMYDRVYCGAACPAEHENYMKNLIKVGGILVMPYNEELLQITRVSQTSWDTRSVMPVSFASLILPKREDCLQTLMLPDTKPLTLQEVCRSIIRTILRKNIDQQQPRLANRNLRSPKRHAKKRCVRRLVIPIFEESDNEGVSGSATTSGHEGSGSESGDENNQNARRHISAVIEHVFGQRNEFVRDLMDSSNRFGFSTLDFSRCDTVSEDAAAAIDDEPVEGPSNGTRAAETDDKDETKMQVDETNGTNNMKNEEQQQSTSTTNFPRANGDGGKSQRTKALFLSKRLTFLEHDSDSSDKEEVVRELPNNEYHFQTSLAYTPYLQEKILALPLPQALKHFLNNYRQFK